ncbi:MAG: hypothetical protein H8E25_09615 [Planctomycetes bacterium]|nr:hypothetical protein [Planctomycetota bacterium]
MLKSERNLNHAANAVIGISGVAYFWMLYLTTSTDEFSILNHPWQDAVRNWHIVLAPLLIFAVALVLKDHVLLKIRSKYHGRGRLTGYLMCALFLPMVFSAYLLQVSTDELLIDVFRYAHNSISFLWIFTYILHQARIMRR